jgi:transglutaminase-like putative cysteine protease
MEMNRRWISIVLIILIVLGTIPLLFWILDKPDIDRYERTELGITVFVKVKNQGNAPATDVPLRLAVPVDGLDHQKVLKIETSSEPERRSNDTWGNEFIHYTIEEIDPGSSFNLTITVLLELTSIDNDVSKASKDLDPDEEDDLSRFLLESSLINVNDPHIIETARVIARKSDDLTDIAWNTYEWILENIYYQQVAGEWDAVTTLRNGEGGSAEMSNLFVALLRANGIPARRISGWGNFFEVGEELALTRFSHGWAEFHVPGMGWVQVDPAWGKTSKFDNFARTDADHIVMTKGADVKFMWRGPYSTPFGDTDVNTDYILRVDSKDIENLSLRRDAIKWSILSIPLFFGVFITVRLIKRRRI